MKSETWSGVIGLLAVLLLWPPAVPAQAPDYAALWAGGETYEEFTADIRARRTLWERNRARAAVPDAVLGRARSVPGSWRLLVVAFDRCSDSVSTIPYLAALVERVDGLAMRVIPPDEGRRIMEANPTPDGRPATPTVLLLDGAWRPRGAWVERPSELQAWYVANPDGLSHDARYFEKMEWYDRDAGRSTVEEVVSLLEAAAPREGTP
ncbi:MAG: thioredoxin family protein [Candidatus Longimicrobiales bacterium M2_2A_002]